MRDQGPALRGVVLGLAVFVLATAAWAGDATSGIPVGGSTPAFQVRDVTGPAKGGNVCYI